VRADAPVVEDLDLHAVVLVAPVRDPVRILRAGKIPFGVAAVAERLVRRLPATAQLHLRLQWKLLAEPVSELGKIRDDVGTVERDSYFRLRTGLPRY
jgi:hypothetical protein